jgi:hypothetical protein
MKFEIHFEFRASLRKFQDLNFWDATEFHIEFRIKQTGGDMLPPVSAEFSLKLREANTL